MRVMEFLSIWIISTSEEKKNRVFGKLQKKMDQAVANDGDMTCQIQKRHQHKSEDKKISNRYSTTSEGSSATEDVSDTPTKTGSMSKAWIQNSAMLQMVQGIATLPGSVAKKKDKMKRHLKYIFPPNNTDELLSEGKNKEENSNTVSDFMNSDVSCAQQNEAQHSSGESSSSHEDNSTCETSSETAKKLGSGPEISIDTPSSDSRSWTKALSEVKKKKKTIKKKIQTTIKRSRKIVFPDETPGAIVTQEENDNKSTAILLEETNDLINHQRFAEASRHLIDLEHKVYINTVVQDADSLKQEQEAVELTYEKLYKVVIPALTDMLNVAQTNPHLLKSAVTAVVQEEQEDENSIKEQGDHMLPPPSRPRKWKEKFLTSLRQAVVARLSEDPCIITECEKLSSFAQHFTCIGRKMKKDLITVVTHAKKCFPEDFDICNIFARNLHDHFSSMITSITEFELQKKDIHCILCWVLNFYPNDILNNSVLVNDVCGNELGTLLPEGKIQELEKKYLTEEMNDVSVWLQRSLELEEDRWKKGNVPERLNDCYHSELPIDVLQNIYGAKERAKEIRPELKESVSQLLWLEFSQFLERYKKSLDEFKEKHSHQENHIPVIIANVNNCFQFRNYLEEYRADSDTDAKSTSLTILNDIEKSGLKQLESLLFQKLKQHYKRLLKDKWLPGSESMSNILKSTNDYLLEFQGLKQFYFQDLLREIHLKVVEEYIRRLMKKKVSFKSPVQQQRMAEEIMQHAVAINTLFETYGSEATFLYPVLSKLSEIIRLQDISAIQIEVACLANDYRDIRKQHVSAILYIKANLSKSEEKSILKILQVSKETVPSDTQELFSHIAVS